VIHGEKVEEDEVDFYTTVQEKNITFPTDAKLYRRWIAHCRRIAEAKGIEQRQSYVRVEKKPVQDQRFGTHPRNRKKARKAVRKLRTIAGRLVRELERELTQEALALYEEQLELYKLVLANSDWTRIRPSVFMSRGYTACRRARRIRSMSLEQRYR